MPCGKATEDCRVVPMPAFVETARWPTVASLVQEHSFKLCSQSIDPDLIMAWVF